MTNILQLYLARIHQIWSLQVIYCCYLSLACSVLELQAGGPDV